MRFRSALIGKVMRDHLHITYEHGNKALMDTGKWRSIGSAKMRASQREMFHTESIAAPWLEMTGRAFSMDIVYQQWLATRLPYI
jgi:hypothetical protein